MAFLETISSVFWSERVWLPPNLTWQDLDPKHDEYQFTNYRHLYLYPVPFAFVLLALRFLVEKFCFKPLGQRLGIKNSKPRKIENNTVLEKFFQSSSLLKDADVRALAKKIDWTVRQVYRWLRVRRNQGKPTTLVKFCECSWRFLYYTSSFIFGLVVLWNKPWFWNIDHCWINYPFQGVTSDVWWYYMISLAFYWSLTFSQFYDNKRKDFWQMFIHHVATIMLLSFSWVCNLHRIGTLVLVIHDAADILVECTKVSNYAKYEKVCTASFIVFMFVWISTRIFLFSFWILRSTTLDAPYVAKMMFPAYYIFNGLLILLLILHIFWTNLILQLAYRTWSAGQLEGDIRSSESGGESEDCTKSELSNNHKSHANNKAESNHLSKTD